MFCMKSRHQNAVVHFVKTTLVKTQWSCCMIYILCENMIGFYGANIVSLVSRLCSPNCLSSNQEQTPSTQWQTIKTGSIAFFVLSSISYSEFRCEIAQFADFIAADQTSCCIPLVRRKPLGIRWHTTTCHTHASTHISAR